MTPSLRTENLTIRFGGHAAVNDVTTSFRPGELTVIVGPNGAGKTTWFNLVSGQLTPTSGRIFKGETEITRLSPSARAKSGIGRAFQLTNLFPKLTVRENIRLVVQARAGKGPDVFRRAAALSPLGAMHQVRISVRRASSGRITRNWLDAFSAICRLGKMVRLRMLNIQSRTPSPCSASSRSLLSYNAEAGVIGASPQLSTCPCAKLNDPPRAPVASSRQWLCASIADSKSSVPVFFRFSSSWMYEGCAEVK